MADRATPAEGGRAAVDAISDAPSGNASNVLLAEVASETARIFWGNRWVAPIGSLAAAGVIAVSLSPHVSTRRLLVWLLLVTGAALGTLVAFAVPQLASRRSESGLPRLVPIGYGALGVAFGSLFWVSPEVLANDLAMWIVLAGLFAISAGVAGMSGLSDLSLMVLWPMWTLAALALFVAQVWVPAVGTVIFLVIMNGDQRRSTELWRELIGLRFRERQQAEENARRANHDDLTGLLNRSGIAQRFRAGDTATTAMFIDLDHFKEANDRFGHAMGDVVLQQVAQRLEASVRSQDMIARIGGDEFFVVFDQELSNERAMAIGQSIIAALEEPFQVSGDEEVWISASVGFTTVDRDETDASRLMTEADHAMLQAKRRGRRQVAAFTTNLEQELEARSGLESALRKAVRSQEIGCAAQPVFDLATGEIRVVEFLARWTLGGGSEVPPSVFIPLAEEVGLIDELSEQMLNRAGRLLQAWEHHPTLQGTRVSVNISPTQIAKGRLLEVATAVVAEYSIAPGRLVLELTESATLGEMHSTVELFDALRRLGIGLFVDDFGTGYSSLGHLLSLPLTGVKIDRSLIADLGTDPRRHAVMRAVRDLANVLGHEVIAEGVEISAQIDALLAMGISSGQGIGLLRPVPLDDFEEHLALLDWAHVAGTPPVRAGKL
jgi:diguanylate cyclase (GGDEF)-like protein